MTTASAKPVASTRASGRRRGSRPRRAEDGSGPKRGEVGGAAPSASADSKPDAQVTPSADPDAKTGAAAHRKRARRIDVVFVDGKVVGQTPLDIRLPCGSHEVKIGSSGAPHTTNVRGAAAFESYASDGAHIV